MFSIETVLASSAVVALLIWFWPAITPQAKKSQPKKRKPSYLIDRISTDGLKRARTVHNIRVKNTNNNTNTQTDRAFAELLNMVLGDKAKAERLIQYEIGKGAKNRSQAIKSAIDALRYDRYR